MYHLHAAKTLTLALGALCLLGTAAHAEAWIEHVKLTASDAEADDNFGYRVALSGNTALVGTPWDGDAGDRSGSAYLFDVTTGQQLAKLTANDAAPKDIFGRSVAASGNTALVGAYLNDDAGSGSGAAYLFDITTGTQLAKLTASDGAAEDCFGSSVAIDDNTALVGAYQNDGAGSDSGAVYVFVRVPEPSSVWLLVSGAAVLALFLRRKRRTRLVRQ